VFLKIRQSENDVTLFDDITTYDYGKFVHLMDPDGNKIELWEP
jgi:predicted enzyme related to lactoylglutathione lyase